MEALARALGDGRRRSATRMLVKATQQLVKQAGRRKKEGDDYQQQQEELVNPMGRSWGYHECALLLTLILGLVFHYGETPTDALRVASTIMRRSYDNLHTLWTKWRNERLVYTIDSSGRGAGAVSHIAHAHHVSVEVIFRIIEYIRYTNAAGTGCTSTELQRSILAEQRLSLPDRTLRSVLSSMVYRYGKGNVIGKMNDEWYAGRIRTFLLQYSRRSSSSSRIAASSSAQMSRTRMSTMRGSSRGTIPRRRRATTWSDRVARASAWCCCMPSRWTAG